jgi:hypothetical protein
VRSHVGPGFVQICLGFRITIADAAFALFLDLFFIEIMLQYNRKEVML